jgi:hypothetical protein
MKFITMVFALVAVAASPAELIQKKSPTPLSVKAAQLKRDMTRAEVIALLGAPTWARLPTDKGEDALAPGLSLELRWKNGNCSPVAVSFNAAGRVNGWDEGRALCFEKPYPYVPDESLSCKRNHRARYCR